MAALRELLLAAERDHQPLDEAIRSFSRSLLLSPPDDEVSATSDGASALRHQFLSVHPQGDLLLRVWPEQHGVGSRWEKRDSFATFLHVVTHLLQCQTELNAAQAEEFALRIIREKSSQLEKLLSWSDKPLIEFRALELLATVAKVSGVAARELVRLFNFQCPAFVKLSTRRWKKSETEEDEEKVEQPFQLRAAYADLVLALTACPDKSVHRFAMKDGGVTTSLFKSVDGDSNEMLTTILNRLGELVLHNDEVEHKSKLVVFNATCVHQLLALLRVEEENVRDTALGVLNVLFFEDSALYVVPKKQALRLFLSKSTASSGEIDEEVTTSEQAYALKVIRNAVGTIGVNELLRSSQAQTLVMQFLAKYPGFLAEYLTALSVQLEPKPVYRWFCVASLVQKLLSCSLDAVVTGLPTIKNGDALSSWCSPQSVASRVIAPGNFRKELSRAIQHNNNLIIYSALGVIEATLKRYVRLATLLESLALASEVQAELRFLLPSPEALVSLLLKLCASQERSIALIYVRALTVFRLYMECLPQAMREVKVDFTKTLKWSYLDGPADASADDAMSAPLQSLIIGEMLRFLLAVDISRLRFLFTSSGNRSKLQQMLLLYVTTPSRAVQELAGKVLQRTLLASDIFGQETHGEQRNGGGRASEEVTFWLESLRRGGSKTCAEFTEQLARDVMSDPLMYITIGSRVMTDTAASSSLSPITVALVGFLNSTSGVIGKPDLAKYRADPCVVAFAVRVLLALMPTSKHPQQLLALIASNDDIADIEFVASKPQQRQECESSSDKSNSKKRKRSVVSDETEREDDAYVWLKTYCEALISEKCAPSNASTPKKKARAANIKWHRFSDASALTTALVAMTPANFTSSWHDIINNCSEVDETFGPVLHYLSSRGDVDILSLLISSAAKKQQQKKTTAVEAFAKMVPVHIVLQHTLFSTTSEELKEKHSAIEAMANVVASRLEGLQLEATDAARMCEQLLFFLSSSHPGFPDSGYSRLCELLLQLLTIVMASNEDTLVNRVVARIFFKLRSVITNTPNASLWRQLSAVEIVALRVYSGTNSETDPATLCSFGDLFQRAGVPLVAVLASHIPRGDLIPVLDRLLRQSGAATIDAPHVVLVERVLESLVENIKSKQYGSFADYKRSKLLTRKLWQLLNCQSSKRQMSFFTTGFTVLGHLSGVDTSTAVATIESSLVPLVVRSAHMASSSTYCTEVLGSIVGAIRSGNEAASFAVMFEEHLLKRLQCEKDDRVKCELTAAIYNVFMRVVNPGLHQFVEKLVPSCYERVLMGSQESYTAELALLKHVSIDASLTVNAGTVHASVSSIVKKLARSERNDNLSSAQLMGLLLLLRSNSSNENMDASLLLVLVRYCLVALKTATSDQEKSAIDSDGWLLQFRATVLMVERAVGSLKNLGSEKQLSALKTVLPLLADARAAIEATATQDVFEAFTSLTAVLFRLVGNDATIIDYDFAAHFDGIVQHPCFVQALQNVDNDAARLVLVRIVALLARITGNYTRSLLQALLSSYSMSLSTFDRCLRVFFEEFEAKGSKELTLASMGFRFGASSTISPSGVESTSSSKRSHNDLVDDSAWVLGGGLEQTRVRATIERFPLDREVSTTGDASLLMLDEEIPTAEVSGDVKRVLMIGDEKQVEAYDPAFLLPMLSHFISSSDMPDDGIVQQGLLGVAIRATSSDVEKIREYAFGILAHLHESLQATTETTSDFKAGRQVHLLLDVFRRGVEDPLEQVPSVVTVFLNDALAVLTRPTHVLYPQVNHFLLARPAMDLADVPMFYSLFNSRAPLTFRQERSWLLHTLRRGVRSDDDMALLVRRHVLPMLLSFYTSELADTHTQPLITSILLEALRTPSGGAYLVAKAALLEWLAAQYLRHGAATKSTTGPIRAASSSLLLPLMTLLEQSLRDEVWDELDTTQQHATAVQAANAFASLQTAITARRTSSRNDRPLTSKAAVIAELVIHRAGSVCSLELLHKAVEEVQQSENALDCASRVVSNLAKWLLQQQHHEAQKCRFQDWAVLLHRVASILVACGTCSGLAEQQRARHSLEQLKNTLDQIPTLKQLLLALSTADRKVSCVPALL